MTTFRGWQIDLIINRNIISKNFRYRTNEFNYRYGFPEEKITNASGLFKRIDYWKYTLYTQCGVRKDKAIVLKTAHIGIEYIAIVFAVLELGARFVSIDQGTVDILLHTLVDFSDVDYKTSICLYDVNELTITDKQLYNSLARRMPDPEKQIYLYNQHSHQDIFDAIQSNIITGSVMHTVDLYHSIDSIIFFLSALASNNIECHYGLGYIDPVAGMSKIVTLANQYKIENISFVNSHDMEMFFTTLDQRNYTLDNLNTRIVG